MQSAAYRAEPSRFLRWARLVSGTDAEAEALLQAAWEADDDGRDSAALRRRAVAVWPRTDGVEGRLRLADVLRRAGLFEDAVAVLDGLPARLLDDNAKQIAIFQRGRLAAGDVQRYLISSALRPPARTPHVAHGKLKPGSFWSRLSGR